MPDQYEIIFKMNSCVSSPPAVALTICINIFGINTTMEYVNGEKVHSPSGRTNEGRKTRVCEKERVRVGN